MKPGDFYQRTLSGPLRRAIEQFPAVVITGPRQSGKTTLVRHFFGSSHAYCVLDDPAMLQQARADPGLLLSRFGSRIILDEIQYAPDLLHAIKHRIDEARSEKGRFVITGSQVFPLMQGIAESLAGRASVLHLQSMSLGEVLGRPEPDRSWRDLLFPDPAGSVAGKGLEPLQAARRILRGGFPDPALDDGLDFRLWCSGYVQTFLERDVRSLRAVGDLHDFQRFLFALAARAGSLINHSDLARDLGVTAKTIVAWISVLEASGQVMTLKPYHASLGKRLIQRPKVFFLDTGVLGYLLGLEGPEAVLQGIAAGPLFETAVFGQLYRLFIHRGFPPRIFFFRTAAGLEVDFVIDAGEEVIPVEARLTSTPRPRDAASIEEFRRLLGSRAGKGLVVCLAPERFPLTPNVDAVPFGSF